MISYQTTVELAARQSYVTKSIQSHNSAAMISLGYCLLFSFLFASTISESNFKTNQNVSTRGLVHRCPAKNVYCNLLEHELKQKEKVSTLPGLGKVWRVDLEFKPLGYTKGENKSNIIHISQRKTRKDVSGERVLSIMTKPNCDLCFSMVMTNQDGEEDNWNSCYNGTQVDQWTGISVSQQKLEMGREDCEKYIKYVQKVVIDGILQFETVNTAPKEFTAVDVFASRPVWEAQSGTIRNFVIQDGNIGKW